MKPNFESDNDHPIHPNPAFNTEEEMEHPSDGDLSDYHYELLSSYIDGEANPEERRQVEYWLATDPQVKSCYQQLRSLSSHWGSMPVPTSEQSAPDELVQAVFENVNRRNYRRVAWGGGAIAALFVATLSSLTFGSFSPIPQYASRSNTDPEPLKIALNEPIVPIVRTDAASITVNQPIIPIPDSALSNPQ
ncbi:anti-sigma factor family protein [Capilliphycus salinus ALCB114379]|uniref:anti-sigma factor family protein n=1 Tax=Capilliphycus salinus TaxID=2768948 RepID=UPI0039A55C99